MVPLPDGTVLIVNGAQQGQAGFAAATEPNLNAVLYDPSLPAGTRFSTLGKTTIPRMYHSEGATRIPRGTRVQVRAYVLCVPRKFSPSART